MVLSRAWQALLWAALVFPGAGHFHLKHFKRGIAFVVVTLLSLGVLLFQFIRLAIQVMESTLANAISFDVLRVAALVWQACIANTLLKYALWALALGWLFGVLDAYRLGNKADKCKSGGKPPHTK